MISRRTPEGVERWRRYDGHDLTRRFHRRSRGGTLCLLDGSAYPSAQDGFHDSRRARGIARTARLRRDNRHARSG
jgi:hypothetical protein